MKVYLWQYQTDGEVRTSDILLDGGDAHIVIGDKDYRIDVLSNGEIRFVLINGTTCKIDAWSGYPCVIVDAPAREKGCTFCDGSGHIIIHGREDTPEDCPYCNGTGGYTQTNEA